MFTIDRMSRQHVSSALRLSTQAGWNQVGADWARLLDLWPGLCLAGRVDGRLVATATLAAYGTLGWVGMVLVDEAHRRRGHGGRMLDAVLRAGGKAGVTTFGLDATDLGRPVYLGRGFQDGTAIHRWKHGGPVPSFTRVGGFETRPFSTADWDSLRALDRTATGGDRSLLLRHLVDEPAVRTRVAFNHGRLAGFGMVRPGRTAGHVGPVVAADGDAARVLVDALTEQSAGGGAVMVDVPRGVLGEWLAARGWSVARRLTRMMTASAAPVGQAPLTGPMVFAGCGFEYG